MLSQNPPPLQKNQVYFWGWQSPQAKPLGVMSYNCLTNPDQTSQWQAAFIVCEIHQAAPDSELLRLQEPNRNGLVCLKMEYTPKWPILWRNKPTPSFLTVPHDFTYFQAHQNILKTAKNCGPSICSSVDPPRLPKLARSDPGAEADALAGHPAAGPGRVQHSLWSKLTDLWKILENHNFSWKNYGKTPYYIKPKKKLKHHEELMKIDTMALSHTHAVQ